MNSFDIVIVGAGVSGLSCARELSRRGLRTVVLERAHGVGGRCATRHVDGQPVDFGCPFLHARTSEFGEILNALPPDGKIPGWPIEVREPKLACQPNAFQPGRRRLARHDGVREFPKYLARDQNVLLEHTATALATDAGRIVVHTGNGQAFAGEFVVLAGSLPQSLALAEPLVGPWPRAQEQLIRMKAVTIVPTLTVMAGYTLETPTPEFDAWHPIESTMVHSVFHDSAKRTQPHSRVLVINSRAQFAHDRLTMDPESWSRELLWETGDLMGNWAARPTWFQTQRWSSARIRPGDQLGMHAVFNATAGGTLLMIGDAFAVDPGLEGAYMSGIAAGEQIALMPETLKAVGIE